jgi:hypothetical protein
MANVTCVPGIEVTNDALVVIVDLAAGMPAIGVHIGGGIHVNMPPTWDAQGATPPGWTKHLETNWVQGPLVSAVPMSNSDVTLLQAAPAQARLSVGQIATLAAAIAARVPVDLEAGAYIPKASAVASAQIEALTEEKIP